METYDDPIPKKKKVKLTKKRKSESMKAAEPEKGVLVVLITSICLTLYMNGRMPPCMRRKILLYTTPNDSYHNVG